MEIYIIYAIIILWVCHRLRVIKFSYFKIPDKTIQQIIGDIGEKKVAKELKKLGDEYITKNSCKEEKQIYIHGYQIDHLVFYPEKKIIFVIETKNWCDRITGSANSDNWIQHYKDGHDEIRCNPIKQNKTHCDVIQKEYPNYNPISIIVFANDNVSIACRSNKIIKLYNLIDCIKYYSSTN